MRGSPETVLFDEDVELQEEIGIDPDLSPQKGRRGFRREKTSKVHYWRNRVAEIADTRVSVLVRRKRGKVPQRIFRPIKQKAARLLHRAS